MRYYGTDEMQQQNKRFNDDQNHHFTAGIYASTN